MVGVNTLCAADFTHLPVHPAHFDFVFNGMVCSDHTGRRLSARSGVHFLL